VETFFYAWLNPTSQGQYPFHKMLDKCLEGVKQVPVTVLGILIHE
jgi:hypothetical protein